MWTAKKRTRALADGSTSAFWEVRVSLGKRGSRKVFKAQRKRDAEEKARAWVQQEEAKERDARPLSEQSEVTVDELVQRVTNESVTASETTKRVRLGCWRRRGKSLADIPVQSVDVARIREWGVELQESGKPRDCLHAWEAVKLAFDVAVVDGLVVFNPLEQAKKFKPRARRKADDGTGKHRIKVYTQDEVDALKAASATERMGGLVHLLFDTGLRLGEALGLQWRDVDGETLHVRRALWEDAGQLELRAEKTAGSRRSIFIAPATVQKLGTPGKPKGQVFAPAVGGLQRKRTVYQMWKRVHRDAGVDADGRTPHSARHTHATMLLARGVPIPDVSRRLGHDSIQTTLQFYAAWMPGEDRTKDAVAELVGG